MNELTSKRVGDVLAFACQYYRFPMRNLRDDDRKAMKRRITRYCRDDLHMSTPYVVTERQMRMIVTVDLRDYFEERLGHKEAVAERKQLRTEARGVIKEQREALASFDTAEMQAEVNRQYKPPSYQISDDKFRDLMIRAMFRRMFPSFDESGFKGDYEEWSFLRNEVAPNPSPADVESVTRLLELDKRIDPAVTYGDISAYVGAEQLHKKSANSHG